MIMEGVLDYQIYHNNQGAHNKIWGWCRHGTQYWAFWGGVGKACAFKHHGSDVWALHKLQSQKVDKGYQVIYLEDLLLLDADWCMRFQERFTICLLQLTA